MRKIAILLTLTMLLASLAGCAGDDESPSPVGEWRHAETMAIDIDEDGGLVDGDGNPGTWSTDCDGCDGDYLLLKIGDGDGLNFQYAVEGNWMWLKPVGEEECAVFSLESIPNDEYDDRVAELTPPSFCE